MSTRKPKYDYLKQMGGRDLSERKTHSSVRRRYDSFHKTVDVTQHQAHVLNQYIFNENRYFNAIVDILQPRLKNRPEFFSELSEEQIKLFDIIAFYCFDVRTLAGKKSEKTELPTRLEPFRDILFGIHGDKERGLSDKLSVFYESLGSVASLWPSTREHMANEMLDFCLNQSKTMSAGRTFLSNDDDADAYRTSPEVLEGATMMQKRHIQFLKRDVELKWNEEKEVTEIIIPYLKTPLIIKQTNITEQFQQWNMMIIHQDRTEVILTNASWEIDFKTTFNKYLIKYLDSVNPNAQMKSRYVRGR